jgi:hypothetical protein
LNRGAHPSFGLRPRGEVVVLLLTARQKKTKLTKEKSNVLKIIMGRKKKNEKKDTL